MIIICFSLLFALAGTALASGGGGGGNSGGSSANSGSTATVTGTVEGGNTGTSESQSQSNTEVIIDSHAQNTYNSAGDRNIQHAQAHQYANLIGSMQIHLNEESWHVFYMPLIDNLPFETWKCAEIMRRGNPLSPIADPFYNKKVTGVVFGKQGKNTRPIQVLKAHPKFSSNDRLLGVFELYGNIHEPLFVPLVALMKKAKEKCGTSRVIILLNNRFVSVVRNRSLMGGAVLSKFMGAAGFPEKAAGSMSGGGGWGSAYGYVAEVPDIIILALNDGYAEAPAPAITPISGPPPAPIIEAPVEPESDLDYRKVVDGPTAVLFDFDKYLVRKDQRGNLQTIVSWVDRTFASLAGDEIIMVTGFCDIRGGESYNAGLGRLRAKEVAIAIYQSLAGKGVPYDEVSRKVRFVSAGKDNPDFGDHQKNRRAEIFVAKKVTKMPDAPKPRKGGKGS